MAQHDYVIDNASGATVRADINSALSAIQTLNSGTSAPSSTAAGMLWLDTTGGAPYALKIRDAGNNHWLTLGNVTDPGADGNLELLPGKINLPSTGGIYESDGSTSILTESSGAVTLDNVSFGSGVNLPASKGASYELVKSTQGFAVDTGTTTSSAYIENLFNSTYRDYVVYITGTVGTTQGDPQFRFGNSSGRNSNSNYSFVIRTQDSGGTLRNYHGSDQSASGIFNGAKGNGGTFNRISITMTIHNPQASGGTFWSGTSVNPRSGTALLVNFFGGTLNEDYQATNMQFYFNTGSGTWNIQSYGIKTS